MNWESVIGLEIHTQLKTKSKIFSGSSTAYGASPNSQVSAIDLGLPGVLPVLNQEAVAMAIKLGLAINANIAPKSVFARKNYFYPDSPKGYQISQFELPIVEHGFLDITLNETTKRIGITRAHLEEDAGKSLHEDFHGMTGIDLNRAGVPLLEIVSEPDLRSAEEAVLYMKNLYALVCYLDICDGNMQEGSFRCDANVSVRIQGEQKLGTRVEIKNINSFKFVEKAINYEIERQIAAITSGEKIVQETRLYDADKNVTRSMRSKEEANDYRYFPDPDLLPIIISKEDIEKIQKTMPELPKAKLQRFITTYALSDYDAESLIADIHLANFFEAVIPQTKAAPKLIANWILGELTAALNKHENSITANPVSIKQFALLLTRIADNTVSGKIAKSIFEKIWNNPNADVDAIIAAEGLQQVGNTDEIQTIINSIIAANPEQLEQYRAGKEKVFGFFVGQVMKAMQGKGNPAVVNELLLQSLKG